MKLTKIDYVRVKNSEKFLPLIHKVPCKYCDFYNDPRKLHKRDTDKYFRCAKCGRELKSEKDDFKDRLSKLLKEENK